MKSIDPHAMPAASRFGLLLLLAAPFVLRPADEFVGESARRIVVVTPHNEQIRSEFGRAFEAWHEATHKCCRSPGGLVVDVGGEHDPERGNFDHHQFPRDHDPVCALSLVLQDLGLYEDARNFCEWLGGVSEHRLPLLH